MKLRFVRSHMAMILLYLLSLSNCQTFKCNGIQVLMCDKTCTRSGFCIANVEFCQSFGCDCAAFQCSSCPPCTNGAVHTSTTSTGAANTAQANAACGLYGIARMSLLEVIIVQIFIRLFIWVVLY